MGQVQTIGEKNSRPTLFVGRDFSRIVNVQIRDRHCSIGETIDNNYFRMAQKVFVKSITEIFFALTIAVQKLVEQNSRST